MAVGQDTADQQLAFLKNCFTFQATRGMWYTRCNVLTGRPS